MPPTVEMRDLTFPLALSTALKIRDIGETATV
jgi:hypothetical protein